MQVECGIAYRAMEFPEYVADFYAKTTQINYESENKKLLELDEKIHLNMLFKGPFLSLLIGYLISIVVFLSEIFIHLFLFLFHLKIFLYMQLKLDPVQLDPVPHSIIFPKSQNPNPFS